MSSTELYIFAELPKLLGIPTNASGYLSVINDGNQNLMTIKPINDLVLKINSSEYLISPSSMLQLSLDANRFQMSGLLVSSFSQTNLSFSDTFSWANFPHFDYSLSSNIGTVNGSLPFQTVLNYALGLAVLSLEDVFLPVVLGISPSSDCGHCLLGGECDQGMYSVSCCDSCQMYDPSGYQSISPIFAVGGFLSNYIFPFFNTFTEIEQTVLLLASYGVQAGQVTPFHFNGSVMDFSLFGMQLNVGGSGRGVFRVPSFSNNLTVLSLHMHEMNLAVGNMPIMSNNSLIAGFQMQDENPIAFKLAGKFFQNSSQPIAALKTTAKYQTYPDPFQIENLVVQSELFGQPFLNYGNPPPPSVPPIPPSLKPSAFPTLAPTRSPTMAPTAKPSESPAMSHKPTLTNTATPTASPSNPLTQIQGSLNLHNLDVSSMTSLQLSLLEQSLTLSIASTAHVNSSAVKNVTVSAVKASVQTERKAVALRSIAFQSTVASAQASFLIVEKSAVLQQQLSQATTASSATSSCASTAQSLTQMFQSIVGCQSGASLMTNLKSSMQTVITQYNQSHPGAASQLSGLMSSVNSSSFAGVSVIDQSPTTQPTAAPASSSSSSGSSMTVLAIAIAVPVGVVLLVLLAIYVHFSSARRLKVAEESPPQRETRVVVVNSNGTAKF